MKISLDETLLDKTSALQFGQTLLDKTSLDEPTLDELMWNQK
jgi:hypothetical protein